MHIRLAASIDALDQAIAGAGMVPLDALRRAVSASYTLLFDERVGDRQVEQAVVDGIGEGYGSRLRSAAAELMLPGWLRSLDEGIVVDRAAFARDRDFTHSAFFDYVIRPEGRFHCLIATPYVTPTKRYHLIVGRPHHAPEFGQADIRVLRALLPYVARLITLANDAALDRGTIDTLAAGFDSLADNVIMLSARGEVEFVNAGAKRLLALRDGLQVDRAKPCCGDLPATLLLAHAIAAVQAPRGPEEMSVYLSRPSGCPPLHVRVRRVAGGPAANSRHRTILLIRQPGPDLAIDGWSAGKLYGLTPKELDIAVLLAKGQDLHAAAVTLGITYQTARSHLRRVFAKTDLHRQSDLIRAVLKGSPRLR